jgi:hypothetical protein
MAVCSDVRRDVVVVWSVQSEWESDACGREYMDFPGFCRALFELVGECVLLLGEIEQDESFEFPTVVLCCVVLWTRSMDSVDQCG